MLPDFTRLIASCQQQQAKYVRTHLSLHCYPESEPLGRNRFGMTTVLTLVTNWNWKKYIWEPKNRRIFGNLNGSCHYVNSVLWDQQNSPGSNTLVTKYGTSLLHADFTGYFALDEIHRTIPWSGMQQKMCSMPTIHCIVHWCRIAQYVTPAEQSQLTECN